MNAASEIECRGLRNWTLLLGLLYCSVYKISQSIQACKLGVSGH